MIDQIRMTLNVLGDQLGTLSSQQYHKAISYDHLSMRKLPTRWVSHLITIDYKRNRVVTSNECLTWSTAIGKIVTPIYNRGRNINSPQHKRATSSWNKVSSRTNQRRRIPVTVCKPTQSGWHFFGMHSV